MPKSSNPRIRHVPLTQARASLGTIVNDVNRTRDYVVVERGGLPVAVIMDIDEFEDYLELRDPKTSERIATSSREHRAGMSVPARDLLADLQREPPASRGRKQPIAKR